MSRERELHNEISRLERDIRDPYNETKWVEQEALKKAQEELKRLNGK